ncbi:MAG: hypothetical protein C4524_07515 [Candidatus Zixiibacteriota bacterium]|nr:MAG: hypothetical protein C4524_07515 [candidate division Zixibacteria bacterium]
MHKLLPLIVLSAAFVFVMGCSEDETPTNGGEPPRQFTGITERDEFGDTLSVDSTDWALSGPLVQTASGGGSVLPRYRLDLDSRKVTPAGIASTDDEVLLGAFPNPFIPRSGRLLIELVLPEPTPLKIWLENESGTLNLTLLDSTMLGAWLIGWNGYIGNGQYLSDGMYRFFFIVGPFTAHGDVEVIHSQDPDPADSVNYVEYAESYYTLDAYHDYEYLVASQYGPTGNYAGPDRFEGTQGLWVSLNFGQKFAYLPVFFNYDMEMAGGYQYHYLLAYKHFQLGAGWPMAGNTGVADTIKAQWQYNNTFHEAYVNLFEEGSGAP